MTCLPGGAEQGSNIRAQSTHSKSGTCRNRFEAGFRLAGGQRKPPLCRCGSSEEAIDFVGQKAQSNENAFTAVRIHSRSPLIATGDFSVQLVQAIVQAITAAKCSALKVWAGGGGDTSFSINMKEHQSFFFRQVRNSVPSSLSLLKSKWQSPVLRTFGLF
jgi:hypothetical protein